ncbi:unnamed protein product [Parnassius apollo]|uniref:(apollo) hypothetical protein n=1 Tax=Parnassius apollo TaxID=110799 RepID=A0A8S3WDS2_PARAO|nr:unnamed protein product [Parnassius apollo]
MSVPNLSADQITEIEAAEACKWLRAAGFPQYAQMYEVILDVGLYGIGWLSIRLPNKSPCNRLGSGPQPSFIDLQLFRDSELFPDFSTRLSSAAAKVLPVQF